MYVCMHGLGTLFDGCPVTVRRIYHKTVLALEIFIKTTIFILWFINQLFVTKLHIFQ
jgi:hypothetical protein